MKSSYLSGQAQSDSAFVPNVTRSSFAQFPPAGAPGAVSNLYALMLVPGFSFKQEPVGALWVFVCQGRKSKFSAQNNSQFLVSVVGDHWRC